MNSFQGSESLHAELMGESMRYKREKIIGEGKTATVYRAVRQDSQGHSRQTVALKVAKNKESVPSLRREFEVLSQIDSVHCVRVLSWENLKIGSALALEWIDGVTLLDLVRHSRMSAKLVEEIVAQAQAGLAALHENGLHHGDLSPVNLLIDREGCLKLLDFASEPAKLGMIHGTPAYVAPEIWRGQSTSAASDLFSLGLISLDLENSFAQIPMTKEECERRALRLQSDSGLLASAPERREMVEFNSCPETRTVLGQKVCDLLADRAKGQIQTVALSLRAPQIPGRLRRMAVGILLLAMAVALPVQATAPLENDFQKESAILVVRAQRWLELTLNGKSIGYAPFKLKGLRPGPHRLCWRNKSGEGEIRLDLRPGETKEMGESQLSRAVNR